MKKQYSIDFVLLFTVICLFVISLIAVYSGSGQYETQDMFYFVKRQIFWYIVGFTSWQLLHTLIMNCLSVYLFGYLQVVFSSLFLCIFSERVKTDPKGGSASVQSKFSHQSS